MTDNDKPKRERYFDLASANGLDDSSALKNAIEQLAHTSDCEIHNAPAMNPGRCDCGAIIRAAR